MRPGRSLAANGHWVFVELEGPLALASLGMLMKWPTALPFGWRSPGRLLLEARPEVAAASEPQNWTHRVRIGGYGAPEKGASAIVREAADSHVFGIEVDNDITGRYESFLDPEEKLAAIRELAEAAHAAGNRAFVYIAGTECITKDADRSPHTLAKDHPDWLQRKLSGEPASFTSGAAFWMRRATRMSGSRPTPRPGASSTWSACARSRPPASTASTWTFPTG